MTGKAPAPGKIGIVLRGMAMGAADVVPGVSGGTMAFITGIYLRLLTAISHVPDELFMALRERRIAGLWRRLDATFLALLLFGILLSVATLAGAIRYSLAHWPVPVWSFFFGLILASAWHVGRQVDQWSVPRGVLCAVGVAVAWWITGLVPGQMPVTSLTLFGSGALAICAMLLPGISGSFILLLLGMYSPVLGAIESFQLDRLSIFGLGCLTGLLLFSRLLSAAMQRFPDMMLALLTGVMLGALNKVWPWKVVEQWRTGRDGEPVPLVEINTWPADYAASTGQAAETGLAVLAAVLGVLLVVLLEWYGDRQQEKRAPASYT